MTVVLKPLQSRLATVEVPEAPALGVTARDAAAYLKALLAADPKHLVDLLWAKHTTAQYGHYTRAVAVLEDLFSMTGKRLAYTVDVHEAGPEAGKTVTDFYALSAYAHAVPRPDYLTARDLAVYFNRVLSVDPAFVTSLVETRIPFDDSKLAAPYVVISNELNEVGLLGLLNGLFRLVDQAVLGKYDDDGRLVGFLSAVGADVPALID